MHGETLKFINSEYFTLAIFFTAFNPLKYSGNYTYRHLYGYTFCILSTLSNYHYRQQLLAQTAWSNWSLWCKRRLFHDGGSEYVNLIDKYVHQTVMPLTNMFLNTHGSGPGKHPRTDAGTLYVVNLECQPDFLSFINLHFFFSNLKKWTQCPQLFHSSPKGCFIIFWCSIPPLWKTINHIWS